MMGRRKPRAVDPALVVSIRDIVAELVASHGWVAQSAESNAERVASVARAAGAEVPDFWTPVLDAETARKLLADLTAPTREDMYDLAEREARDEWMRNPTLRPAELTQFFGRRLADGFARGEDIVPKGEAYGPTDPVLPGSLRWQALERARELDRLRGGLLDEVPRQ